MTSCTTRITEDKNEVFPADRKEACVGEWLGIPAHGMRFIEEIQYLPCSAEKEWSDPLVEFWVHG